MLFIKAWGKNSYMSRKTKSMYSLYRLRACSLFQFPVELGYGKTALTVLWCIKLLVQLFEQLFYTPKNISWLAKSYTGLQANFFFSTSFPEAFLVQIGHLEHWIFG